MSLSLLLFITYVSLVSSENICGDWESFRDEKCFKIINSGTTMTYDEGVEICSKSPNGSTLLTIHSEGEQEFISKYLFETQKIVDNVWLGLSNINNKFEWIDKTSVNFTNWANGSPLNTSDHKCVEMISEFSPIGKWVDIQCTKKNIVVCQRQPVLTVALLQKKLSETNVLLNRFKNQIIESLKMNSSNISGWIQSDILNDSDGKQRKFIFPLYENRNKVDFNEANDICIQYNASLVEINSQEKQNILNIFLDKLIKSGISQRWFYINGHKDSSGKWIWLKSGNSIIYNNWDSNYPTSANLDDYIVVTTNIGHVGKWANIPKTVPWYSICEIDAHPQL